MHGRGQPAPPSTVLAEDQSRRAFHPEVRQDHPEVVRRQAARPVRGRQEVDRPARRDHRQIRLVRLARRDLRAAV